MRGPIPCKDCRSDTGSAGPRCPDCEKKRRDQWQAWLDAGKCPRCQGKRDLNPKTQSCFECGFGVGEGDDYVDAIFNGKRPRLAKKWLGGGLMSDESIESEINRAARFGQLLEDLVYNESKSGKIVFRTENDDLLVS